MARDGSRSLAGGAVVETRLCARLLGVKLLVVDGVVTVWPAQPDPQVPVVTPAVWTEVRPPLARPAPAAAAGGRLGDTAQRLEGTAQRLRRLRSQA